MTELSPAEKRMRIKRQRLLLEGRREEYRVFGMTGADAEKDQEIREEIVRLEQELAATEREVSSPTHQEQSL